MFMHLGDFYSTFLESSIFLSVANRKNFCPINSRLSIANLPRIFEMNIISTSQQSFSIVCFNLFL